MQMKVPGKIAIFLPSHFLSTGTSQWLFVRVLPVGHVLWKINGSSDTLDGALQSAGHVTDGGKIIISRPVPAECFAVSDSPIWMDASTSEQCKHLEKAAGSPLELANITGSRAYERFTGNQIAKIAKDQPDVYDNCERISLVSSFLASIFLGSYAPIDFSDGSGMNLLNIHSKECDSKLLDACAKHLLPRLDTLVPSCSVLGGVSQYMANRTGISPTCKIVAFTGDNPSSLAGMRLHEGDMAVSLGTSDTLIFWMAEARPALDGHVFVNPIDKDDFMAMLCFKNGSLTRQNICERCCGGSWDEFNRVLQSTPAGNNGNIGIYFDEVEIIPFAKGFCRQNAEGVFVESFPDDVEVRGVIEGQFIGKRYHAEQLGYRPGATSKILATGGASSNSFILQILSDVFNLPVYALSSTANSACLGGIYRAKHALVGGGKDSFREVVQHVEPYRLVCSPVQDRFRIYSQMLDRYKLLETKVVESSKM